MFNIFFPCEIPKNYVPRKRAIVISLIICELLINRCCYITVEDRKRTIKNVITKTKFGETNYNIMKTFYLAKKTTFQRLEFDLWNENIFHVERI